MLERVWSRPTFEVHGIAGGFTAAGAKTVIPAKATAKVSFRLVPRQNPDEVLAAFQEWVRKNTPKGIQTEVRLLSGSPGLVVKVLFGPAFQDAQPYVLLMGCWGLALSLGNLLVQFLMAVHDRAFVPILGAACVLQPLLITVFHAGVGQVVADVLITVVLLLATLIVRCLVLLPRLRPEMLIEETQ